MRKAEEYRNVIVAWRNGAPVKLEEIANVIDSVENDQVASWFNDNRAVVLAVQRQPGANTVAVVDAVRAQLPSYRAQVPAAIDLEVLTDRSISIRNSVDDVQFTLGDRHRARDPGDLPVPALGVGDHHSGAGGAGLPDRHLRDHVCARISPSTT